ncbi:uncharacterized protein [Pyrus communis]|uniref:uncharacterized protein n=1 Tax=Pyrus communis TaxID=23211 RepID=UPI0035C259B1
MENFLHSKEYWSLVETGISATTEGMDPTEAQKKAIDDQKLKDLKAKNYLFQAIDRSILDTILKKDTTKDIWDSLKQKKAGELVNDYFRRTFIIANKMRIHGEMMEDVVIIEKILRSMTPKYDYVRISRHTVDEQAVQITHGTQLGGRGGGRGTYRGRGRFRSDKSTLECYSCHELGHFQWECPKRVRDIKANFAETSEEMLLMAYVDIKEAGRDYLWFLDSGCNNHMCGKRELFSQFDSNFRELVKLGTSFTVLRKGSIQLEENGIMQVITRVFFVPKLKNNLLSIGQLQEKGLAV